MARQYDLTPDDLDILDNGIRFAEDQDRMEYIWYRVREREDGREYSLYRVVRLGLLRYLPQEHRQEPGIVERMRAALVGLYGARRADYDLVEIKAGIFNPPLGVLQMYGSIGIAPTLDEAVRNADLGMAAVTGAIANFEQSRLTPVTVQVAEWLRRALAEFPHVLVVVGQPQPRRGRRGMGREGPGESRGATGVGVQDEMEPPQQGEMLCRALAAVQEEFLMVTLASRVAQRDLARMLAGTAAEASVPASMVSGSEAITAFQYPRSDRRRCNSSWRPSGTAANSSFSILGRIGGDATTQKGGGDRAYSDFQYPRSDRRRCNDCRWWVQTVSAPCFQYPRSDRRRCNS